MRMLPTRNPEDPYESRIGWGLYDTRGFSIQESVFGLQQPGDGSTISTGDILFTWDDVGADHYKLRIDDNPEFGTPEADPEDVLFNSIEGTSFQLDANWLPAGDWNWSVIAVMSDGSERISDDRTFTYSPPVMAHPDWVPLYRLYKAQDKDHFYCTAENHQGGALLEGYVDEGVEGHVSLHPFASPDMVPLYRFWHYDHEGGHFYAAGNAARETALADPEMRYEGISGYAHADPGAGLVPLYYLLKDNVDGTGRRDNFYTISEFERQNAVAAYGFSDMGPICYVSPVADLANMPWSPYTLLAGLGVNPENGNFSHGQARGFHIPGHGLPLRFSHRYNSRALYFPDELKSLSPGWSHDYSSCIVSAGGLLYVIWSTGEVHLYSESTESCLVAGVYDDLDVINADQISIRKKSQLVYTFSRPAVGYPLLLSEIRDRNGNTISCTYTEGAEGDYRLTRVTGPANRDLNILYHQTAGMENLIHTVTDPMGRQIRFEYDPVTLDLQFYFDPEGHVTEYDYDASQAHEHQLATIRPEDGPEITNTYLGRKLMTQRWSGQSGGLDLNYSGDVTTVSNLSGPNISTTYLPAADDLSPRLPGQVSVGGSNVLVNYDHAAHPTLPSSIVDPRGNSHLFYYDTNGNMIEESHPLGVNSQYQYDSFNNLTRMTDPRSNVTINTYDGNGNLVAITRPEGEVTQIGRGTYGQVTSVTEAGGTTVFSYDQYGNQTQVRDPLGHTVDLVLDMVGRVTSVTDANDHTTSYEVDDRGLVTRVSDPAGGQVNYGYDGMGRMISATGPDLGASSWTYDGGFMTGYYTPGCATTYSYNQDGTLADRSRPLGGTSYGYDNQGRLISISGALSAGLTRDQAGNVTQIVDDNGTMTFDYDAMNRLTSTTDYWNNTVAFTYDRSGNTKTVDYGSGKVVTYEYDRNERLLSVQDWSGRVTSYTYDSRGLLQTVTYPNQTQMTVGYDLAARLTSLTHSGSVPGVIAQFAFSLDPAGNQTGVTATLPLGSPQIPPGTGTLGYNSSGQMVSDGSSTYTYDAQGNLSGVTGARNLTIWFDRDNRLLSLSGQTSGLFLYDIFGNRRQAIRSGLTTRYVLDPRGMSRVLMETDESGNPLVYYIYGKGLVGRIKADGAVHYYHGDALGSVLAMTDQNGVVSHRYSYDPFGRLLDQEEADPNPFTFVGMEGVMREGADLYYMRARYYDSRTGRFLSEDPIWRPNLYVYAGGNPLRYSDPEGMEYSWGDLWEDAKTVGSIVWDKAEEAAVDPIVEASQEGLLQTMWAQVWSVPRLLDGGIEGRFRISCG